MKIRMRILKALLLVLVIAPAVLAQQQSTASADSASSDSSSAAPLSGSKFPFPEGAAGKSKKLSDVHIKPGSDFPHWEAFFGYSFLYFRPQFVIPGSEKMNGGSASIAYNFNRWAGLVFDFGGYHTGSINATSVNATGYSYLFGPRFSYRSSERVTPYAQLLFGGVNANSGMVGILAGHNEFGMAVGGGLDVGVSKHLAWRMVQAEYLFTDFNIAPGNTHQNSFRISTGLLVRWGARPIEVNRAPTATCSADAPSIVAGSGTPVPVHVSANDPDGDSLTYTWSSTGGRVDGTGADARWMEGNAGAGEYTVSARVDDGHGGSASCSTSVRVNAPPPPPAPRPPVMSCSVDRASVMPGERVSVTASASSPQNFTLSYEWRANAGQVVGTGASVQFDTTGLSPGSYVITGRVNDGHGQAADCTANVGVDQPPAPPQASKVNECAFKPAVSARVDNVCKRVLDDVALRLQNEPKGTVVIIGFADPKDKQAAKTSTARAQNAADYLAGKGIDKSRITVRSGSGQEGAGAANQRIDIVWVPDGASF
jgi:hypothetical protein